MDISKIDKTIMDEFYFWTKKWKETDCLVERLDSLAYRKIIEMGKEILPLILRELERRHDYWFQALEEIVGVGESVSSWENSRLWVARYIWLEWGRKNGYL